MRKLPIALQVYSVRDFAKVDFRGTMEKVKQMGYEGVEVAGLYGHSIAEVKNILDEVGLTLVSAHVSVDEIKKDGVLEAYAAIGIPYVVIPWMMVKPTEESVNEGLATIRHIATQCSKYNLRLLYHNHDFEFQKFNDAYILDIYYDAIDAAKLQTELDTCWVKVGGADPVEYIHKYAGRAPIVHLKDYVGSKSENMYALIGTNAKKENTDGAFELRPVGYGCQNMPAIIEAAVSAGTQWLVVEQDKPSMGKTSMECAQMSIEYLRKLQQNQDQN